MTGKKFYKNYSSPCWTRTASRLYGDIERDRERDLDLEREREPADPPYLGREEFRVDVVGCSSSMSGGFGGHGVTS